MSSSQSPLFWAPPITLHLVTVITRCRIQHRPLHQHLFYELSIMVSGRCNWILDKGVHSLKAGDALLLPPGMRHGEHVPDGKPCSIIWIGFDANRPRPNWCNRVISLGDDVGEIIHSARLLQQESISNEPFSAERQTLLLQTILLLLTRHAQGEEVDLSRPSPLNDRQREYMESAAHYFRQNLGDCLTISQVAAYYSLCPAHFSRLFQLHHGLTPSAFLHRARLEHSARLLVETRLNIKEIAGRCGFSDPAHFCKAFRKFYGKTPSCYRESFAFEKLPAIPG